MQFSQGRQSGPAIWKYKGGPISQARACSSWSGGKNFTEARALPLQQTQGQELSTRLGENGDLRNLTAMRDHKVEIIPIRATFPAFEVLKNDQQARFRSTVDFARNRALL